MPLILHAAWLRGGEAGSGSQLFLWAEEVDFARSSGGIAAPGADAQSAGRSANGRPRARKVPSHPVQASVGQVRAILTSEFHSIEPAMVQPANATVWLPSTAGLPMARRGPFEGGRGTNGAPVREAAPELAVWQVTGLALKAERALLFLAHLGHIGSRTLGEGAPHGLRVRLGNDLLFWSNAAKFALEILVAQQYLPIVRMNGGGRVEAVWQPLLLDPRVEQRRNQLVASMPPVCRAYNLESPADAPSPAELAEHFVSTVVDGAVRAWCDGTIATPDGGAADLWLQCLLAPNSALKLPPQPAHELFQEWRHWTETLFVVRDANFRICFALEEPEEPDDAAALGDEHKTWKLNYFLQARDNPQLMVSARQVWDASNNRVRVGKREVDRPQERLLAGLGVASRLFAPVERSLRNPRPELSLLSTDEAYAFLRDIGPVLESSGFGVIVPDWWQGGQRVCLGLRLRLGLAAEDQDEELNDLEFAACDSPVAYRWELTLGGDELSPAFFDQLAAMRTPLLRLRERWVELEPGQVDAAKQFLARPEVRGATSLIQAIRAAQQHGPGTAPEHGVAKTGDGGGAPNGLPPGIEAPARVLEQLALDEVVVSGNLRMAIERLREQEPPRALDEPKGFAGELRPYQKRGFGWLVFLRQLGLGACLADDMGLGKTIQAIALLLHTRVNGAAPRVAHQPALLICPTSVVANWRREIERFGAGLRLLMHHGNARLGGATFLETLPNVDLVITSFGTARRDIELLRQVQWSDLILDEAQNIKTAAAKQTQAIRQLQGGNRIALTGTPVENRLAELWSIMEFLNPGYLGSFEAFRRGYVAPIERYGDEECTAELRRLVRPFLLRRLKSDPTIISDLPDKNEMVVFCSMTREQVALYQAAVESALAQLDRVDGIQRRGQVLALLTKLKQITNHPAHYLKEEGPLVGRSGKLTRLTEMLEEALSVGDRALVFTQFVEMGHLLQKHLANTLGADVLFLHGGTPALQRDKMVQTFQGDDGPPIFVLSLRAGGSGVNLTSANHVFHYDRWWNPAVENQATDRAFRIGQRRNVQVHKFVVAGTLEESIHELIESKQSLAEAIVGSGEEWLTELGTEELRTMLTLRIDAIEDET